jgi:hypothetical protein
MRREGDDMRSQLCFIRGVTSLILVGYHNRFSTIVPNPAVSVRNGNLEVSIYFLKAKQEYTVRKKGERKINGYSIS